VRAYPLSAIVGSDDLVLALLLTSVAPEIGGVLVRGEKGTAKSTAVRGLARLLPPVRVALGCRFACDPGDPDPTCPDGPHDGAGDYRPSRLVELPVGATEDRLLGSLDLERALSAGVRAYEPGLLASAHRGILYVDEVNLLHDHLVDVLLDAAAMGRAHIEREGLSITHAARFVLVGTMNPEEGELRPQLLDRFGLAVEIRATRDPRLRAEVVRRRLAFDADPDEFAQGWAGAEKQLADRVVAARSRLPGVRLGDAALEQVTGLCAAFDVDGLRGDLVLARTARAHAAWHGRDDVTTDDVRVAARFALPHRRRRDPLDTPGIDDDQLESALDDVLQEQARRAQDEGPDGEGPDGEGSDGEGSDGEGPDGHGPDGHGPDGEDPEGEGPDGQGPDRGGPDRGGPDGDGTGGPADGPASDPAAPATTSADPGTTPDTTAPPGPANRSGDQDDGGGRPAAPQAVAAPGSTYRVKPFRVPGLGEGTAGRRSRAITPTGRTVGHRPLAAGHDTGPVHLSATVAAAAPHQSDRGRSGPGLLVRRSDLRVAVREGREGNLVLFCVDASGSMAARARMTAVKGAVMSLLLDAYQRRDRIGLITFRGDGADLALPPTGAVEAARGRLDRLPTGGRTPVDAGLRRAIALIATERLRDPRRRPLLVLVTDGRHTHGPDPERSATALARAGVRSVVVDCESGPVRLGLAGRLAQRLNGELVRLDELRAEALAGLVREHTAPTSLGGL
jgi:magnesium chelatase subunit D